MVEDKILKINVTAIEERLESERKTGSHFYAFMMWAIEYGNDVAEGRIERHKKNNDSNPLSDD